MRESRPSSWATAQGLVALRAPRRPPHSIPAPDSARRGRGPLKPVGRSRPRDPLPRASHPHHPPPHLPAGAGRSPPPGSSHWALRIGEGGAESTVKGGVPNRLAEDRRCAGERVPTPLPSRSARAPRSGLPCATRPAAASGEVLGLCGGRLGVREAALLCRPTPAPSKVFLGREGPRTPPSPPCALLSPDRASPGVGAFTPQEGRGRRCWRGAGGAGLRRGSPGSLITSACSAPAPSSQLPSNTREFNSSINRREALHFGERWRGWVGLGGGSRDSTGKQAE